MKRIIIAAVAILLAVAAVQLAIAQPHPGGPAAEMRAHVAAAAQYLNLSDAQKASWDAALNDVESQNAGAIEKSRSIQRQLNDALASSSPDACAIGNLAIQAHASMDQMKNTHQALLAKLSSYLTPDQKAKFDAYVAAAMAQHREPGPPPMH
ncbi:MAG TPA: Spy/CpxP family protein refolding chaperone [Thermoanaerobaculia bacterium]